MAKKYALKRQKGDKGKWIATCKNNPDITMSGDIKSAVIQQARKDCPVVAVADDGETVLDARDQPRLD